MALSCLQWTLEISSENDMIKKDVNTSTFFLRSHSDIFSCSNHNCKEDNNMKNPSNESRSWDSWGSGHLCMLPGDGLAPTHHHPALEPPGHSPSSPKHCGLLQPTCQFRCQTPQTSMWYPSYMAEFWCLSFLKDLDEECQTAQVTWDDFLDTLDKFLRLLFEKIQNA